MEDCNSWQRYVMKLVENGLQAVILIWMQITVMVVTLLTTVTITTTTTTIIF
jgi:hypothetical protein